MPGMPERHSKDCKVSVGSETTAHRREIRLDFSATDALVRSPFWVIADMVASNLDVSSHSESGDWSVKYMGML